MGLERCLALRWQEERPALQALRRDYAAQALARLPAPQDRNEGESLRGCWWARALDQPHRESSREKAALDQLEFPQTWSGDQVRQGVEDLLLDGSASQNGQQEKLAAQAYLIAASLGRCQIPVRVSSFCSVSGCTVLRVYRDYQDKGTDEKIFDYAAAGWNRDGLALRAMGWLLDRNKEEGRRLLIVLSDASPNDDQKIPSNSLLHGNRDYSGVLGVKDAAQEAAALRKKGVEVVCIFTGGERELPAARQIYGREVVRLPGVSFLAQTVSRLIQGSLTAGDRL